MPYDPELWKKGLEEDSGTLLEAEAVIVNPQERIVLQAFTSEPFKRRLEVGIKRICELRAESSFVVIADQKEIAYTELTLGTSPAESGEFIFDFPGSTAVSGLMPFDWRHNHDFDSSNFSVLGELHFHPDNLGFSDPDIELREKHIDEGELDGVRFTHTTWSGIVAPKKIHRIGSGVFCIFMYSGYPQSNNYQIADNSSGKLSLEKQAEIFRNSGLKVVVANLLVVKGTIDLNPLRTRLLSL